MKPELAAEIIAQYQAGWSLRALARHHNIGYSSVHRALMAANVPRRPPWRPHQNPEGAPPPVKKGVPGVLDEKEVERLRSMIGWRPDWI